uniref:Maternal protein exuperantia n=1 Tax=Cacopsylla melanoneura TaxID=428564 RepID=A0A8D8ZY94_9HEMI
MVSGAKQHNGAGPKKNLQSLPFGNLKLVGWDLDTTGRRLIDEICQISGYTPEENFNMYIMPHRDIDMRSKRRHALRTVNAGKFRVLKDNKTNKVLRTKSEISALTDFLEWLEKVRGDNLTVYIVLLCHETYKLNASLLLEALRRNQMLDRFSSVVKGFADCHSLAKDKCQKSIVQYDLRTLCKMLLNKENTSLASASERAKYAYQIVEHLCAGGVENGEGNVGADGDSAVTPSPDVTIKTVLQYASDIEAEENNIQEFKVTLERQNTLKPVFYFGLKTKNYKDRQQVMQLRSYVTSALIDYEQLQSVWNEKNGKEGIEELINTKLNSVEEKDRETIIGYIVKHFEDPTAYEKARAPRPRRSRRSQSGDEKKEDNKENSSNEDKEESKQNGN